MKFLTITLFLITFFFSNLLNAQENPWSLRQSKDGITIYTRKVTGSPILEYKANVTINAPIDKVTTLFEDVKQVPHWYYECVQSKLIENENPNDEIVYLVLHFPWPVAARDFVFRRTKIKDASTGAISYRLTALPNRLPLVKGMIRVNSIESIWIFKPLANNQTDIFFQQHTDPGGSIPISLVNQLAVDTPFYSLKNFRKLATGKDT